MVFRIQGQSVLLPVRVIIQCHLAQFQGLCLRLIGRNLIVLFCCHDRDISHDLISIYRCIVALHISVHLIFMPHGVSGLCGLIRYRIAFPHNAAQL